MALSRKFVGTGVFVPEKVWSCPDHEFPEYHECDCSACSVPLLPECCQNAAWVDKTDANGDIVLREVGEGEDVLMRFLDFLVPEVPLLLQEMPDRPELDRVYSWNED